MKINLSEDYYIEGHNIYHVHKEADLICIVTSNGRSPCGNWCPQFIKDKFNFIYPNYQFPYY